MSVSDNEMCRQTPKYDNRRKKYSNIWTKFTISNSNDGMASCNICGVKMSYKSTVTNLKKHILRKHSYDVDKSCLVPFKRKKKITSNRRPNLTELGGLDGLILNVVGDEGEDHFEEVVGEEVEVIKDIYSEEEMHNYCAITRDPLEGQSEPTEEQVPTHTEEYNSTNEKTRQHTQSVPKVYPSSKSFDRIEKNKKNRIMDLQLECLQIKKYTMQMEALMLENQLNLPRSVFTENLRNSDTFTRGTQTDVGGNNTKVFYVSDSYPAVNEGTQHFFTFRARADQ